MTEDKFIQYREAAHLAGQTRYLPDLELYEGTLRGYAVSSPYAHARLIEMDTSGALAFPGVVAVVTANDIPGPNTMAPIIDDEPCLLPVGGVCSYMGHVVCLVAADSLENAKRRPPSYSGNGRFCLPCYRLRNLWIIRIFYSSHCI